MLTIRGILPVKYAIRVKQAANNPQIPTQCCHDLSLMKVGKASTKIVDSTSATTNCGAKVKMN